MAFGPGLTGDGLVLRAPVDEDVEAQRRLGRSAEIRRMLGVASRSDETMTIAQARSWRDALGRDESVEWIVEHEGAFLGVGRLHSFQVQHAQARYAVALFDESKLGRGFGRTVTRLIMQYGFDELGLSAIDLLVLDFNERAQRCYRACGFWEVERLPAGVMDHNRPAEDIRMIATPESFAATNA
ncbi:MAG: hypothetical protein QOG65_425 [Actinomycetota bacterium]|jgi:RimJ/RimL family protein N-acetyltransferase|nr:hypothetical protein [Actinomycetota bacterium]